MNDTALHWEFGGVLSGGTGWLALLAVAAAGFALTFISYRGALQKLPTLSRRGLMTLRIAFLILLLICLANPTLVKQSREPSATERPVAVLVDRSASMLTADNRGHTRLDNALKLWRANEKTILGESTVRYFQFSDSLSPVDSIDAGGKPGSETRLFDALETAIAADSQGGFGEIFCLTDGNDTTQRPPESELIEAALKTGTALSFVAGTNRLRAEGTLLVREIQAPSEVLRRTKYSISGVVEVASSSSKEDLHCEARLGDQILGVCDVPTANGAQTVPWNIPLTSAEPAFLPIELRFSKGPLTALATTGVQVIEKSKTRVLVYQGQPNWGIRFMIKALRNDPNFEVTSLINLANIRAQSGLKDEAQLTAFPKSADGLKTFNVVVLSNVYPTDLDAAQQTAIFDYVKAGGGVFFGGMDAEAGRLFSGSPLERMLPVVFEKPPEPRAPDSIAEQFQAEMKSLGGARSDPETAFAEGAMSRSQIEPLYPLALPSGPIPDEARAIFGTQDLPRFAYTAPIRDVKAGATVLGIRAGALDRRGKPIPLMIQQRFGDGHATVLTTDLLWRWQMSLPSDSAVGKRFWQQMITGLSRPAEGLGLRFVRPPWTADAGKPTELTLDNSEKGPVIFAATTADGRQMELPAEPKAPGKWITRFTPAEPGYWMIEATNLQGRRALTSLDVRSSTGKSELSGAEPDLETMRRLAGATGGRVIDAESGPARPRIVPTGSIAERKEKQPLWNVWPLLIGMLGLYSAELIWRRRRRML